ncbi:phenylalanyl-tRNA synthetase subunit alpha [Pedobacter sp.]|nr:phenylalanyl-tRNA synthetase subunit alpha [Pedobacter sp.]
MSNEILEVSVLVEEKFDMSFNWLGGLFGFILRVFGK